MWQIAVEVLRGLAAMTAAVEERQEVSEAPEVRSDDAISSAPSGVRKEALLHGERSYTYVGTFGPPARGSGAAAHPIP